MNWSLGAWWRADREHARAFRQLRSGQPGEAVKTFDRALAIFPKEARTHLQRALALAAAGRTSDAVKAARRAAELDPRNSAPPLFLGQIHYDAGAYDEARKAFSAAAQLDPANQLVQAYLGLSLLALGKFAEGVPLLEAHLAFGYERLEGRVLLLAERYLWERRDRARPLEAQLNAEEGGRETGPAPFALRVLSALRWIVLYPLTRLRGKKAVYLLRASEAASIGDFETTVKSLRAAEAAGADPQDIALSLGQAYYDAGKPEAAAEHFARLPEEVQQEPEVAALVGAALFESGRYQAARDLLALAAARFRQEFIPAYYLAMCELALGRHRESLKWFEETAARLNPHVAEKRLEEMARVSGLGAAGTARLSS
jgi:tetratricopeptide (TPR) repeat protein